MALRALRDLARALRDRQAGFTLVELSIAVVVMAVGMLGAVTAIDRSREFVSLAERREAGTHIAERAMEQIMALPYGNVALMSDPAHADDATDPLYHVTNAAGGDPIRYKWDHGVAGAPAWGCPVAAQVGRQCWGNVVSPASGVAGVLQPGPCSQELACGEASWGLERDEDGNADTSDHITGRVYRFVTWEDDLADNPDPDPRDYKRITVVVTVDGSRGVGPIVLSSKMVPQS